ncbi:hypothetical protein DN752_18530 [Echinicola strongylocentroti]|uniref:Uncharacterized protein n=1 Tax=Echinicola strongylocentroti TaxID=1795355 RepID=A0A2Z4IMK6_9BACT|nr:hypothetical protein [Echinicola strongylocentroti]AWW31970.1 hypothetical protein DN752_18530 [Echinicola strongylocentroti]
MKKLLFILPILAIALFASSCSSMKGASNYEVGMEESDFLKIHPEAVISSLEGTQKTYRVVRDERFYLLATFEDERLIKLEEKELPPYWNKKTAPTKEEEQ